MEAKRLLKELRLSIYEAEAYLKIVELGIAEASGICKKTKIPFGRVYQELKIPKMEYMKEQGIKEKIMDNVEIRVMKRATPSYFEVIDAEKVVLKVNNPKNPAQILAMTKIWDVKLAKEIREIFEEMWSEAKPIELT